VYCQLETLRHCLSPGVRGILATLPETLDETYERVLREINKANRGHAHRLLHCLTVAMRPLRVEELAEVLTVDFDAALQGGIPRLNPDWRWADQHQAVLSTCSSLIAIVDDGDSQVVQFSHFSVKEFLTSDRLARSSDDVSRYHILLETAHTLIAQACLGVLLRLDDGVDKFNVRDIPLAEYAAQYWVDHAQFENVSSRIQETMEFLFDMDKPHWAAWIRVYSIDAYWDCYSSYEVNDAFPLYYASLCGFYNLVEHLIGKYPEYISAHGGHLVTPLVAALFKEHFQVAELLFQHGADVDVRGINNNTPLTTACSIGPEDVVLWLLDHGADANHPMSGGYTSLHLAAFYVQLKSVEALLEHGADINARNRSGEVPLHLSACPFSGPHLYQLDNLYSHRLKDRYHSHLAIVQLLLNYGADANTRDNTGSTPLHHSSCRNLTTVGFGTTEGAHLLLKHGASIDAKDNEGRTPLQIALVYERHGMARFFSEHGATRSA
jgi:ankyrin repeat protein